MRLCIYSMYTRVQAWVFKDSDSEYSFFLRVQYYDLCKKQKQTITMFN